MSWRRWLRRWRAVAKKTEVAVPVTLLCCPHVLKAWAVEVGDVREVALNFDRRPGGNGDTWHFAQSRIALSDEPCDCAPDVLEAFADLKAQHSPAG